jgi:hypothetical protein
MRSIGWLILGSVLLVAGPASALSVSYRLAMDGGQEVPNAGDPDGSAMGTLSVDDVTGEVSWNFTYSDIDDPTQMHIHIGAAGVAGGVLISLGVATSGGPGTLIGSLTADPAAVSQITANPFGFYVNIHNEAFPAGAVRGQLGMPVPEPSTAALCLLGLVVLGARGRGTRR